MRDICIKRWVFIEQSSTDTDNKNITTSFGCGYPSGKNQTCTYFDFSLNM